MELWTSPTPNGWKVTIMLEELVEAGIDIGEVNVRTINLMKGEQFESDFTERNPNQKIPAIVDHDVTGVSQRNVIGQNPAHSLVFREGSPTWIAELKTKRLVRFWCRVIFSLLGLP